MPQILLDQNVPVGLRQFLIGHDVRTAYQMGWSDLSNGELLTAAEAAGIDLLISCDQNLRYQQNLVGRRLAVLVLDTNRWTVLRTRRADIERAVASMNRGSFVQLPLTPRQPRTTR